MAPHILSDDVQSEPAVQPGVGAATDRVRPPSPPPMSASPPRILIIGAGSRGRTYARSAISSSNGVVVAVAEPDEYKRRQFGRKFIWGGGGGGTVWRTKVLVMSWPLSECEIRAVRGCGHVCGAS